MLERPILSPGSAWSVLPSGTNGRYNAAQLAAFLATGATVPHCCEQLPMYGDLVYATPGLKAADVGKYFKDSTFGVGVDDSHHYHTMEIGKSNPGRGWVMVRATHLTPELAAHTKAQLTSDRESLDYTLPPFVRRL